MKRSLLLAFVLIAVVAAAALVARRIAGRPSGPAAPAGSPAGVLGVERFMNAVDHFPGLVRVEGVVRSASVGDHLLTLIDRREFEECGVTTCAALYLPVRWTGELPETGAIVRVEGQAKEEAGKLVFVARQVERMPKP